MKKKLLPYIKPDFVTFQDGIILTLKGYENMTKEQKLELMKLYEQPLTLPIFAYTNPFGGTYP
jgi:hypothetical protein